MLAVSASLKILCTKNLSKSLQKGSLNGTADDAEEKLDGISKMNETLKKNSLDINILKFLPYRLDSLDNGIGNISDPHQIHIY